jgi:glycosyltransferase involved in cell wall biosynthesis
LSSEIFLRAIEVTLRKVENFLFQHVDWVVTHGPKDHERIKKLTAKVTSVPSWVDTEMFKPLSEDEVKQLKKELLEIEEDAQIILFVGRLHPMKNIETLLYAYKTVVETHRNVILTVVGTGPEEKKCKELVERLGLTDKVKFLGHIPSEKIARYYNIADMYVLTSLWEEWSNTIMEAMASGVPVIATSVGGNPHLVKDKETGFLVPPKDPNILAEKIRYVLDHSSEMEKIASDAYLSIRKFSKQDIGELQKKIIVDVINAHA